MHQLQRLSLIIITKTFRIVFTDVLYVLAGVFPAELLINELEVNYLLLEQKLEVNKYDLKIKIIYILFPNQYLILGIMIIGFTC